MTCKMRHFIELNYSMRIILVREIYFCKIIKCAALNKVRARGNPADFQISVPARVLGTQEYDTNGRLYSRSNTSSSSHAITSNNSCSYQLQHHLIFK